MLRPSTETIVKREWSYHEKSVYFEWPSMIMWIVAIKDRAHLLPQPFFFEKLKIETKASFSELREPILIIFGVLKSTNTGLSFVVLFFWSGSNRLAKPVKSVGLSFYVENFDEFSWFFVPDNCIRPLAYPNHLLFLVIWFGIQSVVTRINIPWLLLDFRFSDCPF